MTGMLRTIKTVIAATALVAAFTLVMGINSASALTIGTENGGWTPDNFRTSCKAAGGRVIEIDQGDIKYSKCVFPDGSVNKCDWIKKICTFGIVAGPFSGGIVDSSKVSGTLTTSGTSGGSTSTGTSQTSAGTVKSR
jgi:hypothetical protein